MVGSCDDVVLDGSTSSGSAGRTLEYAWTVVRSDLTRMNDDDFAILKHIKGGWGDYVAPRFGAGERGSAW